MPDPRYDAVRCIVMAVMDDDEDVPDWRYSTRMLLYDEQGRSPRDGLADAQVPSLGPSGPTIPPCTFFADWRYKSRCQEIQH